MADAEVTQETTQEELSISKSSVQEPQPETSAAAPQEQTVSTVTEKITVTKKETKPRTPPPAPVKPTMAAQADVSSTTVSSVKSTSVREYTDTSTLLSDLSRDYRGTSPAVLESIATHPAIYSSKYLVDRMRPRLSARSRKVIRDAEDLAIATPGLKHMLEVQYQSLFVCLCALLL